MFLIDKLLLLTGLLMVLGSLSSKFSARVGLPVLVLFLALGMIAGSEGLGRIPFENFSLAHAIGTVALAFILFDGGLKSPLESLKVAWKPSALLATFGVLFTSLATGFVAMHVLDLSLLEGMLLGSIVGSTDAAAVFTMLRSAGIRLRPRIGSILELESGANDPMAIFLTVGLIQVLTGETPLGPELLILFVQQMGIGLVVGWGVGRLAVMLINRVNLATAGLYPVLTAASGMLTFGLAAALQGSGFLAIYVAGLVLGNSKLVFQRGTLLFHDGIAWAGQIAMFVVLGLVSSPSSLLEVAAPGLLIATALIFVARPLAIVPLLVPFRFSIRELTLISWVGLKGAVPIILATYPLIFGIRSGGLIFNVVFFVVLLSAVVQGTSLPWVARLLKLEEPLQAEPPLSLEITSLRDVDADIVDYPVGTASRACEKYLSELAMPAGAVVALVARGKELIPPRGTTRLLPGDHVFIVVNRESRDPVDRIFARDTGVPGGPLLAEFPLPGTATSGDLAHFYDIETGERPEVTLEQLLRQRLPVVEPGATLSVGEVRLRIREMQGDRIISVGLSIAEDE
ncbi:MAG TPA: potassium/proton antiporter [Polyangiaceae bacterium]|nr:potassium/proton antiporter [Polyangiaceae bacterium]